jgi:DNA-binding HxlR family transcriptional regulator
LQLLIKTPDPFEIKTMARDHTQTCPIASALNIIGDHWTLLIVREALYGATRFGTFQKNTGIAKNLLASRLEQLVENGLMERTAFADRGTTHTYRLTEKGCALEGVMSAITLWSNTHIYGAGAEPVVMKDCATGLTITDMQLLNAAGKSVARHSVEIAPGPGASSATKKRLAARST